MAVILNDNILENQSADKFFESFGPKVFATRYLDELSRSLCPNLKYFVVFSSAACGRGNAGQTNYGMANSIMERIVEKRVRENFPGTAIQWVSSIKTIRTLHHVKLHSYFSSILKQKFKGAVGEVGLVAQMAEDKIDMVIAGTVQQRISACLSVLDNLLSSKKSVVASMVVAQKHTLNKMNLLQRYTCIYFVDCFVK